MSYKSKTQSKSINIDVSSCPSWAANIEMPENMRWIFADVNTQWHRTESGIVEVVCPSDGRASTLCRGYLEEIAKAVRIIFSGMKCVLIRPQHYVQSNERYWCYRSKIDMIYLPESRKSSERAEESRKIEAGWQKLKAAGLMRDGERYSLRDGVTDAMVDAVLGEGGHV